MNAARVCNLDAALSQLGVHQLANARCCRVKPLEFSREQKLFGPQREADENVRVGHFIHYVVVAREMDDSHFGPPRTDPLRHFRRRIPQ